MVLSSYCLLVLSTLLVGCQGHPRDESVIIYPRNRYVAWSRLDDHSKAAAFQLGYFEITWNQPGTARMEKFSYNTIVTDYADQALGIEGLGWSAETWDCYMNHYSDYSWSQLYHTGVQQSFITLGWNSTTWGSKESPLVYSAPWLDLTADEMEAADDVCFFQELWEGQLLSESSLPLDTLNIRLPKFRYLEWNRLDTETRASAELLGYTNDTWNLPGTAPIEAASYSRIVEASDKGLNEAAIIDSMGFTRASYDCYINHFNDFTWRQLESIGVQKYLVALGWNQTSWNQDVFPEAYTKQWSNLNETERTGAEGICYFRQLWDKTNLGNSAEWSFLFRPVVAPTAPSTSPPSPTPTVPTSASTISAKSITTLLILPLISYLMSGPL